MRLRDYLRVGLAATLITLGAGSVWLRVAPAIGEALIATAVGLVAALPAVLAYNYFVRRIQVLESERDAFASDYLNIVRRHFLPS